MLNIVGYLKPQGCLQPLARTWDAGAGSRRILPSPALPLGSSPRGRAGQPAPCNLLVCHFAHSIATVKRHLQSLGRTVWKGPPSRASGLCWQTRMGVKLFSNRFWGTKKYTLFLGGLAMTDLECTLSITQGISSSLAHPGALLRSIH